MSLNIERWTESLATNIVWQDYQHKQLLLALENLASAISREDGTSEIQRTLQFLENYTQQHFGLENEYMTAFVYDGSEPHMKEHAEFSREVRGLKSKCREGANLMDELTLCYDLNRWVLEHIDQVDQQLADFLREKGVR